MVKAQDLYALSEINRITPAIAYRLNHNHSIDHDDASYGE